VVYFVAGSPKKKKKKSSATKVHCFICGKEIVGKEGVLYCTMEEYEGVFMCVKKEEANCRGCSELKCEKCIEKKGEKNESVD